MRRWAPALALLLCCGLGSQIPGCIDGEDPSITPRPLTRVITDRTYLRDGYGRYVFLHGVNLSGSTKVPTAVDTDDIPTYAGKPFDLEDADRNFALIRDMGFDSLRLLVVWEGLEPTGPGQYDTDYLNYLREVVIKAGEYGLYVLMDMHQDIFSRHLKVFYNHHPSYGEPGSVENTLLALVPDEQTGAYDDVVQGDGAPRWAVEACLPEKDLDSPYWGTPRIISGLDLDEVMNLFDIYQRLLGGDENPADAEWAVYFLQGLPGQFPVNETSDLLPFTFWGVSMAASLDVARCFGCMLAGDALYPELQVGGVGVEDYLQASYTQAWKQVALRVADLPNVIGYDLMNEPSGNFLVLAAVAGMIKAGAADGAEAVLTDLLGEELGPMTHQALVALRLLPPDTEPETLRAWGLDGLDLMAAIGLNINFDEQHMRPFYERVAAAILEADPQAVIFIERALSVTSLFGTGEGLAGIWEDPMTHLEGVDHLVFAPHWYPDIYPNLGFNQAPREFKASEQAHRDYRGKLEEAAFLADYSLGKVPVVFGEFGTYFNFNGIAQSREDDYLVSAHILDNYYEAFEAMFASRIQWCYSPENDYDFGDLWNHEDFSVVGPDLAPRGELAWARPHARFLAGMPVSTHYHSPLHYFDPAAWEVPPVGEFEVRYKARETHAPTEIVVPVGVYHEGFFVWVSDGLCHFDAERRVLYHLPGRDEPGFEHWLRIRGPLEGLPAEGWQYFFTDDGDRVLTR